MAYLLNPSVKCMVEFANIGYRWIHDSQRECTNHGRQLAISVISSAQIRPPYYDNIGYADLSDFFYVWLRRTLTIRVSRPLRHTGRTQGRRVGCHALPAREQSKSKRILLP